MFKDIIHLQVPKLHEKVLRTCVAKVNGPRCIFYQKLDKLSLRIKRLHIANQDMTPRGR